MTKNHKASVPREYLDALERKVEDLKILTEISATISSTLDFSELINLVMEKAKSVMEAEACSILLYNSKTGMLEFEVALCGKNAASHILKEKIVLEVGQGIAGWVAKNNKILVLKNVRKDTRFFQEADKQTGFKTKSLVAVPLVGRRGLIGVAEIINPKKEDYDMDILQILAKQVAISIENSLFHRESIERERLRQELEIAAVLQKSFLPESPVYKKNRIAVSAINLPAKQVGGDLYDFIEPLEGKAGVFIGDISGKGVSAALFMAKTISEFRHIAQMVDAPEEVMGRLNVLFSKAPRGMFLTAIYMIVDVKSGTMRFSNAGHPPFLLLSKRGVRVISSATGPPLGIITGDYAAGSISLEKGDRIILLTDGVFDAKDKDGKRLGFEKIVRFVNRNRQERSLVRKIEKCIADFSRGTERADDITLVELRVVR
jgi:sigma-B regulation protein RsbU (phosphoserine phosphatase)